MCIRDSPFDKTRLFYTQGDYGLWQCVKPCHEKTYDNEAVVRQMIAEQRDMRIPTDLIPKCPVCGAPMTMNLRSDNKMCIRDRSEGAQADGGGKELRTGGLGGGDFAADGIVRNGTAGGISLSGTYETAQDYIDALNAEKTWVKYDSGTNTATITSVADFVSAMKTASKDLGAFDALDESQGENILFGDGDGEGDHFDAAMAQLLKGTDYETAFAEDLERTDALGTSTADRVNMYNPLYYLSSYYDGYQSASVASHWRIRSGISQSDTALTTEVNLALALENYGADVDFETVCFCCVRNLLYNIIRQRKIKRRSYSKFRVDSNLSTQSFNCLLYTSWFR